MDAFENPKRIKARAIAIGETLPNAVTPMSKVNTSQKENKLQLDHKSSRPRMTRQCNKILSPIDTINSTTAASVLAQWKRANREPTQR